MYKSTSFFGLIFLLLIFLFTGVVEAKPPLESGLNTPLEQLHKPLVRAPETVGKNELFFVSIQVGQRLHPLFEEHTIEWIGVSLDNKKVFRAELTPLMGEARMTFPLRLQKTTHLKVEAHCNLHGTWAEEFEVKVKRKLF